MQNMRIHLPCSKPHGPIPVPHAPRSKMDDMLQRAVVARARLVADGAREGDVHGAAHGRGRLARLAVEDAREHDHRGLQAVDRRGGARARAPRAGMSREGAGEPGEVLRQGEAALGGGLVDGSDRHEDGGVRWESADIPVEASLDVVQRALDECVVVHGLLVVHPVESEGLDDGQYDVLDVLPETE